MDEVKQRSSLGASDQWYPCCHLALHPLGGPELHTIGTQGPITCTVITSFRWAREGQGSSQDTRHLCAIHPQVWDVDETEAGLLTGKREAGQSLSL